MQIIRYPDKKEWGSYLQRPHRDASELRDTVRGVLSDVRNRGDEAVKATSKLSVLTCSCLK